MNGIEEHDAVVNVLAKSYFKPSNLPPPPSLPANHCWSEIQKSISKYPVTIIVGSTGCGKTTQVPQLLLEHELYKNRRFCRMVVTQPRRIAAISVAHTVCRDRNWEVGSICGYQVGMDRELSDDSCIQYVTTNILVERIIHQKSTEMYTHIIVDEIHERHQDLDCLLFLLKTLPTIEKRNSAPKIILMSATAESELYARYFGERNCNRVSIEGSVYSVEKLYIEDLPLAISNKIMAFTDSKRCTTDDSKIAKTNRALVLHVDVMKTVAELIETFNASDRDLGRPRGAVLIFVPGIAEIGNMIRVLNNLRDRCSYELIPLHSKVPLEEQNRAFKKFSSNVRKIIVATNIAESSITVPDIRFVIDFCLTKQQVTDSETSFTSYQIEFCSRANCDQRAGRAGRVQNGVVYRLVTKEQFMRFNEFPVPEILRCPVDMSVLKLKSFGLENPKDVLSKFIDPPSPDLVERAILTLKEVQAMQLEHKGQVDLDDGDLTILGKVMASLPLDTRLSKLILMGFAFGCFEECVKMAACLSVDDIVSSDIDPLRYYSTKMMWARGHFSDPLTMMHAFDEYLNRKEQMGSDDMRSMRRWALDGGLQHRRLVEAHNVYEELKQRLSRMGFSKPQTPNMKPRDVSMQNFFVMMALCGAFYPHYYPQKPIVYSTVKANMGGRNPMNTMILSGFVDSNGPIYAQAIRAALSECLYNEVRLTFDDMDAFLTFENNQNDGIPLDMYLCELFRRKQRGIDLPKIPKDVSDRLLAKLGMPPSGTDARGLEIAVLEMPNSIVNTMKKPPLPTDKTFRGCLTWFEDILTFFVRLEEREPKFSDMCHEINNELRQRRDKLVKLSAPAVGTPVLAEYEERIYRARVLKYAKRDGQEDSTEIRVFFYDYGNTAVVSFVYELPESMLLCTSEAPFAYKAQLAHIKLPDGIIRPAVPYQKLREDDACRVEIFSIVDDVLRVTLFVEIDGEEVNLNDRLVYHKYVIQHQEPDFSQDKSKLYTVQNLVLKGQQFDDINRHELGKFNLIGPRSPLVSSYELQTMSKGVAEKTIEVTQASINHVLFGDTGINQRFLVAHVSKLSQDKKRLQLMQTTLMTKLPMMLPFVSLVFSPRAEYRCNEQKTKFIGAICGMGATKTREGKFQPVNAITDLEVPFTHELDRTDAKIINEIRRLLNEAFCGNNEVFEWTSVPILRIQKKIEDYTLRFFNIKNRVETRLPSNRSRPKYMFKWGLINPSDCIADTESARQSLFRPHPIVRIKNDDMFQMLELTGSFLQHLSDPKEVRLSCCPLCCETFRSNDQAIEHCRNRDHQLAYAKLEGTHYEDDN